MADPTPLPTAGFARGSVVRMKQRGPHRDLHYQEDIDPECPNILVVRGIGETAVVITIEGDGGGQVHLRELKTEDLELVVRHTGQIA